MIRNVSLFDANRVENVTALVLLTLLPYVVLHDLFILVDWFLTIFYATSSMVAISQYKGFTEGTKSSAFTILIP